MTKGRNSTPTGAVIMVIRSVGDGDGGIRDRRGGRPRIGSGANAVEGVCTEGVVVPVVARPAVHEPAGVIVVIARAAAAAGAAQQQPDADAQGEAVGERSAHRPSAEAGRSSLSEPRDRTGARVSFMMVSFE